MSECLKGFIAGSNYDDIAAQYGNNGRKSAPSKYTFSYNEMKEDNERGVAKETIIELCALFLTRFLK